MRAKEITKIISKAGGELLRQRGSHQRWQLTHDGQTLHTTVPVHTGDVPIGTAKAIQKDLEPLLGKGWLL